MRSYHVLIPRKSTHHCRGVDLKDVSFRSCFWTYVVFFFFHENVKKIPRKGKLKHYDRYGTRGSDHVGIVGTYLRGRVQLFSRSRTLAWVRDHFFPHSSTEIQHFLARQILLDADAMLSLRCLCHGNLKNNQGEQCGKSDENLSGISSFSRCDLVSVLSFHREYSMDVRSRESSHVSYGRFDSRSNFKSRCNALRLSLGEESVRQDLKCR